MPEEPENVSVVPDSGNSVLSRSRHERVGPDAQGQRIDNFLLRRCPGVPRSHIYQIIRKGEVRVDGGRVKPTRKLKLGEQVRIPPIRLKPAVTIHVPDRLASSIGDCIMYEHADFLVVSKPPGIAVHGGSGLVFGLIDALRQALDQTGLELVHRLDRGTSGCLLIARNQQTNRALQNLFRQRRIKKRYMALMAGRWPEQLRTVNEPLLKNVEHAGERRVVVDPSGLPAVTHFNVLTRYTDATLLDIDLDTGRTHQIRVHAQHAGHAVVGDSRYGDNATNTGFRQRGLSRLFLHATALEFAWQGESIAVVVEPDKAWKSALAVLSEVS